MKVGIFEHLVRAGATRRDLLKGAASVAALAAASTGTLGALTRQASAQDNLRAEILKIPGVGKGSPTDADWQKVGELCLGATKANVAEGEFAGVELTFMGLNNQNLHNFLFRGFLKPWEAYTGAKINWIDLAQADYNPTPAAVDRDRHGRLRHHRRWAPPSRATRPARACSTRCPTGSRPRSIWTTTSTISRLRSAPGTARPTASPSTATATPSPIARTISATARSPAWPRCPSTWEDFHGAGQGRRRQERSAHRRRRLTASSTRSSTSGAASASTSSTTARRPMPSTRTIRLGCSTPTR